MRPVLVLCISLLAGCSVFQKKISDYEHRSTVYAWIDIKDLAPNHLSSVNLFQHRPATDKPYYGMATIKMDGGYLLYTHIPPEGAYKLNSLSGQSCMLFLCGNTFYTYDLGKQGDQGTVVIKQPGVYFLGSFKLSDLKTGWFQPGKFEVKEVEGPSQQAMLEKLLLEAPKAYPVVGQRIQRALDAK